jgi:hypothetical protein
MRARNRKTWFSFGALLAPIPVLVFVFILSVAESGRAQESSIQGTVTDPSKAVIPGAEVTITKVDTAVVKTAVTNQEGLYLVPLLKEGRYKVACRLTGFSTQEAEIRLEVGQVARVDFRLKVGAVNDTVKVTADAAKLQSKPLDVGQVIDEKRIQELPLNGRNYLELAQLSVGVVKGSQGGRGEQNAGEGSVRAAGQTSARVSNGPLLTQAQAVKPPPEAISEFKVLTNNVSAEYGYKRGAKVIVSTKSGTNDFHGTAYEFHRNASLAANNFMFNKFNNPGATGAKSPQYIRNQFGATFGGPIIRDKTFFFANYEGSRIRQAGTNFTFTVPSAALRQGDFSQEPGGANRNAVIYDPLTLSGTGTSAVRQAFPNNRVPSSRWDPVTSKVMTLFPLPNCFTPGCENRANNYFVLTRDTDDADQFTARIDHNFNSLHRAFGRYTLRNQELVFGPEMPFPASPGRTNKLDSQNLALNYSAAFSNKLHNELRFGYSWFPTLRGDLHTEDLNGKYGIKGAPNSATGADPDFSPGLSFFNINTFRSLGGIVGGGRLRNNQKIFNVGDNFLMQRGRHSFKFGGEFRSTNLDRVQGAGYSGTFGFSGVYTQQFPNVASSSQTTGNSFASFLLGYALQQAAGPVTPENVLAPYWGFYVQDDWQVSRRLTLTLGVRWELFDGPYYPDGPDQPLTRFSFTGNAKDETVSVLPVQFSGWKYPTGGRDCACKRDLNNWAPRLGLAYRLTDKTVIRAGGGIYYGESDFIQFETGRYAVGPPKASGAEGGTLTASNETTTYFPKDGLLPLTPPYSPNILTPVGTQVSAVYADEYMPTAYTSEWFLDVQRELPWNVAVTLGYNGNSSAHLNWWRIVTAPTEPHAFLLWNSPTRRRWPQNFDPAQGNLISLQNTSNILNSHYDAFTFKAEKRFSNSLTFLNSFTWAKSIDYGRSTTNANTEAQSASATVSQMVKDLRKNKARSDLDRALVYNLSFLYELPAGRGRRWLQSGPASWVLGGWQLGGILSMQSGPPMSHTVSPDTQNTLGSYRGDYVKPADSPGTCSNGAAVGTVDCWFNTGFAIPGTAGTYGNAGRTLINGPGWKNFDFVASKEFPMPFENHRLQIRFESFNLTNTTHLGAPGLGIGTLTAGQITVAADPRIIQFGLKYVF